MESHYQSQSWGDPEYEAGNSGVPIQGCSLPVGMRLRHVPYQPNVLTTSQSYPILGRSGQVTKGAPSATGLVFKNARKITGASHTFSFSLLVYKKDQIGCPRSNIWIMLSILLQCIPDIAAVSRYQVTAQSSPIDCVGNYPSRA